MTPAQPFGAEAPDRTGCDPEMFLRVGGDLDHIAAGTEPEEEQAA